MDTEESEAFIFIGKESGVYFFLHTQTCEKIVGEEMTKMSCEIYNAMINQTMIQREDKVLVYNIDPRTKVITPVSVNHVAFKDIHYPEEELQKILIHLMNIDRSGDTALLVIMAKFNPERYLTYELPMTIFPENLDEITLDGLVWAPLERYITIKDIPYLDIFTRETLTKISSYFFTEK